MTDFRALCAELADALAEWQLGGGPPEDTADADLINRARAALAEPEPEPVAVPVPVSERLPGPEDCDKQGLCWLWERDCGYNGRKWALEDRAWSLSQSDEDLSVYTHWLPTTRCRCRSRRCSGD